MMFVLVSSSVSVFAEPAASDETVAAEEAAPEETAVEESPEAAPVIPAENPVFPELPEDNSFTVKNVVFDKEAQTISFTLINSSDKTIGIPFILLDFDSSKITTPADYQNTFPAELASQLELNMEDGVIVSVQKSIKPDEDITLKFDAVLADSQSEVPEYGLRILVQEVSAELNFSSKTTTPELRIQNVGNIMALDGNSSSGDSFFAELWNTITNNWILLVVIFVIVLILLVILYFVIISKVKKLIAVSSADISEDTAECIDENAEICADDNEIADNDANTDTSEDTYSE